MCFRFELILKIILCLVSCLLYSIVVKYLGKLFICIAISFINITTILQIFYTTFLTKQLFDHPTELLSPLGEFMLIARPFLIIFTICAIVLSFYTLTGLGKFGIRPIFLTVKNTCEWVIDESKSLIKFSKTF